MKKLFTTLLLSALSTGMFSQFSGAFAPANWGTVAVNSDGTTNTSGAPANISITSGDNSSGTSGSNDFTITIPQTGHITFTWSYSTSDGPQYDYPQFVVNGNVTLMNGFNTNGSNTQSGSQPCINVNQGDVFRFRMYTVDNVAGPGMVTISNFSFSTGNIAVSPPSASVCPGNTVAFTASGATSYSWSGGISNGTPFTPSATTVYTVSGHSAGCLGSKTASVLVYPPVAIISSTDVICNGASVTLSASSGSNFSWSTGSTNPSITVSPAVTTSYTLSATNSSGCNLSIVATVTVLTAAPSLTINNSTANTNSVCSGKSITLTASGAATYTWAGSAPITNGVPFTPTVTETYTVTGGNACGTSTAITTVTVAPLPVGAFASSTLVCQLNTATLTAAGGTSYTWAPGSQTISSIIVTPSVNTIYTVSASDGTCFGMATLTVNTKPNPTITVAASNTNICAGESVTLTASGADTYVWTPASITGSTGVVTPLAPVNYQASGTNSVGCTTMASQVIIVKATPTIVASSSPTLTCVGGSVTLSASSNADTFLWSTGSGSASTVVSPTVSGTYTVTGTISSSGCSSMQVVSVGVYEPVLPVSPSTSICMGSPVTLTAGAGTGYSWSNGSAGFPNITVSPTVSTIYSVSAMTSSNNLTCLGSNTIQVTVLSKPTVTAAASRTVLCRYEKVVIDAGGANTYTWSNNFTGAALTFTSVLVMTHNLFVIGEDANGCLDTATIQVKVNACTGIEEQSEKISQFLVYPNPCNGELTIQSTTPASLLLVNELGQVIRNVELDSSNGYKMDLRDLSGGVYFLTGRSDNRPVHQKIIVNR